MSSGAGAVLGRESGVRDPEFVVVVDATAANAPGGEALVRMATGIDRDWIVPTSREVRHEFDAARGVVRAVRADCYGELVLNEHSCAPDSGQASAILERECLRRGPTPDATRVLRRLRFAGIAASFEDLVSRAVRGVTRLEDVSLGAHLEPDVRRTLARDAPDRVTLPGGGTARLDYRDDGSVAAAAKLQALFGLRETPRIGPRGTPVIFELLAPNGRPVQVTSDLRSFWTHTYPQVRPALRARYPKHAWPE